MDTPRLQPRARSEPAQDQEGARAGEPTPSRVQEELWPVPRVEVRPAAGHIAAEGVHRGAADRDDPLPAALADGAHEASVQVDARAAETDRFRDAEAGAVQE